MRCDSGVVGFIIVGPVDQFLAGAQSCFVWMCYFLLPVDLCLAGIVHCFGELDHHVLSWAYGVSILRIFYGCNCKLHSFTVPQPTYKDHDCISAG